MDLSFARICTVMEESGIKDPKKLTVFEFNAKLDFLQQKNKQK